MDWARLEVLTCLAGILLIALIAPSGYKIKFDTDHLLGLIVGALVVAGTILFYIAVSKGPVSVIVPLSSLYVVGVFIFGVTFFGEQWSWQKLIGVACAVAAIILLAGEEG